MAKINVLPTHIANMIAAGEVVERPASVVKELLENALDAGARHINIAIRRGGRELISITDDGCGIAADDLPAALTAHATSKIASVEDLEHVSTMGFRGEALASIASIAKVTITSRTAADTAGSTISAAAGELSPVKPCASPVGTAIEVRDLFFNTPARRKFMRTDSTEFSHISAAVTRVALGRLDASIILTHNDRKVLNLPATDSRRRRIADIFDEQTASELLEISPVGDELRVGGLIGTPASVRSTTQMQYFLLNGRYIRDKSAMHALKEAYRGMIDPRRHPVAFLYIDMPPEMFDVNVHPTKIEVRFADSRAVHSHVLAAVRETLQKSELRPQVQNPDPGEADEDYPPTDNPRSESLRQALSDFFKARPSATTQPTLDFASGGSGKATASGQTDSGAGQTKSGGNYQSVYTPPAKYAALKSETAAPAAIAGLGGTESPSRDAAADRMNSSASQGERYQSDAAPDANAAPAENSRRAFQLHNAYIVVEEADSIVIIDQHALHERVMYNRLLERMAAGSLESQGLLIPATLSLTPQRQRAMDQCGQLLESLGIELSQFGPDSVAIHRFPSLADRADPAEFIADLLDRCSEDDQLDKEHILEAALAMMACKAAIKAGDKISEPEIHALLDSAEGQYKNTACPHGRPTQIRLTLKDLEKQFHRT